MNLEQEVEELRAENARLRSELGRPRQGTLHPDVPPFTIEFPFVWPSLKNTKRMERRGHRMALVTHPEVKAAAARIRAEVERQVPREYRPLFGTDEVSRSLHWDVEAGTIEVTWRSLGPMLDSQVQKDGRKRDLVNLGALLDDAVGRERVGRQILRGSGLIYNDDAQIARATEERTR